MNSSEHSPAPAFAPWMPATPVAPAELRPWTPGELGVLGAVAAKPAMPSLSATELAAREAERLAAEAAAREQALATEAYAAGRADGFAEAQRLETERLSQALLALDAALAEVRGNTERWTENAEENVCAVAVAVARHVVGRELRTDGQAIANLVRRALAEFVLDQPLTVRLHPQDLALIGEAHGAADAPALSAHTTRWVPDAQLVRGGCLVEGRERIVDGRLDTALERAYRRLTRNQG